LFGQSEEDLVFRKLTEIDGLLMKDYGTAYRSVAELIEDTCVNLNSEKINSIWAKMQDINIVSEGKTDRKIRDYAVTVCGWVGKQSTYPLVHGQYANIWIHQNNVAKIPYIQKVIQDIQETSKDWRCANRVTKYLNGSIDLLIKNYENLANLHYGKNNGEHQLLV